MPAPQPEDVRPRPMRSRAVRIVVVGGGIAGLAAAHRLVELAAAQQVPLDLILLEARDRLGGIIATERIEDFLVEGGPDSFLAEKPWASALCERLGIADHLIPTRDTHRRTFVVDRGRLVPLPDGFLVLGPSRLIPAWRSPLLSWRGKARMTMELLLPRGRVDGDESVGGFVTRRFGREVLDRVVQPLVSGIYGADPSTVSLAATMPRFMEMERRYRSITWALARSRARRRGAAGSGPRWNLFVTPAEGMEALVTCLARRLPPASLRLRRRVTAVGQSAGPHPWRVDLVDGTAIMSDAVILATPAPRTARLVSSVDPELGRLLEAVPYASSATVTLAYRRTDLRHPLDGFGFVVPQTEGRPVLACTFSSVKYPGRAPDDHVLLRAFMGGAAHRGLLDRDDESLVASAAQEFAALLGVHAPPRLARVHRHAAAMPHYLVGHAERVAAMRAHAARYPGLALAGNAYEGIGIPDCIHSGEVAAEQVMAAAAGRPDKAPAPAFRVSPIR
ncbi:MAG TPA: protoporphyrinogen oxidase [bacterium]|nr:protoporphyrinogen oxidase [bacterium]